MRSTDLDQVKGLLGELERLRKAKQILDDGPVKSTLYFHSGDEFDLEVIPKIMINIEDYREFSGILALAKQSVGNDLSSIKEQLRELGVTVDA